MIRYVAFTLILSFLSATTINIPADYETVQEGIDAAQDGDIVVPLISMLLMHLRTDITMKISGRQLLTAP